MLANSRSKTLACTISKQLLKIYQPVIYKYLLPINIYLKTVLIKGTFWQKKVQHRIIHDYTIMSNEHNIVRIRSSDWCYLSEKQRAMSDC